VKELVANLKRKLEQAFPKFEFFWGFFPLLSSLLPKEVVVELMKTNWVLNFHRLLMFFFSSSTCFIATPTIFVIKGALAKQKKWVDARFNTIEQLCFPSSSQFVCFCSISIIVGVMAKLIKTSCKF